MKIALIGYGKMGKEIEKIALERGHEILFRFDITNREDFTVENLKKTDVAIEFTQPDTAFENYLKCFEAHIPVVSGTTGWLEKLSNIKEQCKKENQTFFYASNFSIGVNITFRLNKFLAEMMNKFHGYSVSIMETHHTEKKDAPSGTAITLADDIISISGTVKKRVQECAVDNTEIAVHSIRMGNVPGIHTIKYESAVDYIEITHSAKNRKGLAEGAVSAAEYAIKNSGFLTMNDLLGI
jgi:4-hydroxy-tetrahydrodipicolinate reductase